MTLLRIAALAALSISLLTLPAFAHHGVMHDGCPAGQVFTAGDISVTGAYTRAMLPGAPSAGGYLTISNSGSDADTLTGVSTEAAKEIAVHQMKMDGDVMQMAPVAGGLEIPAGGTVELAPRGYHLMMMGLDQVFEEGECVEVTLQFARAGDLVVQLSVGGIAQDAPPDGNHEMTGMDMPSMEMSN